MEGIGYYPGLDDETAPVAVQETLPVLSQEDGLFRTYLNDGPKARPMINLTDAQRAEEKAKQQGFFGWLWSGTGAKIVKPIKEGISYLFWGILIIGILAIVVLTAGTRFLRTAEGA